MHFCILAVMTMHREFTATTYILDEDQVLLIYHRKLQKWLPPGGHIDPNETPPEAAKREAREECGLEVELALQENIWIEESNAVSMERPFLCLLENIPAHGPVPAHQHMDMIYVARPIGGKLQRNQQECADMRWFTLEEVEALQSEEEIFHETKRTIRLLLGQDQEALA